MNSLETLSEVRSCGGVQGIYRHHSSSTGTPMQFALYQPPQVRHGPVPVLWYLSGLTCSEENFTVKAGAQRYAAQYGLMLVVPDTSPRGAGVMGEEDTYDLGTGAGFYVDATELPWASHYRMHRYVSTELPGLVARYFPMRSDAQGITGHSMGGHGALTLAMRHSGRYRSVSAFAPICAPSQVPWGRKALGAYLGEDEESWRSCDSVALIEDGARCPPLLVDQGSADEFLEAQLKPELLRSACAAAGQPLTLRYQDGYDHSYYFVASFIGEHLRWHAQALGGDA